MLKFFYAPQTRATGVRILLEELGAPYELHVVNRQAGEQHGEAFRRVNPLGKVPVIEHDGAIVTEQVAIYTYLADAFPERGLAPAIGDRLRGPYLRFMAFYGSAFEPAMVDHAMKRDPGSPGMSPYGSYDGVIEVLAGQLGGGPYMLGERFSALDVLWGTALGWMTAFKLLPDRPEFAAYVRLLGARPAFQKVNAEDAALAATHRPQP